MRTYKCRANYCDHCRQRWWYPAHPPWRRAQRAPREARRFSCLLATRPDASRSWRLGKRERGASGVAIVNTNTNRACGEKKHSQPTIMNDVIIFFLTSAAQSRTSAMKNVKLRVVWRQTTKGKRVLVKGWCVPCIEYLLRACVRDT